MNNNNVWNDSDPFLLTSSDIDFIITNACAISFNNIFTKVKPINTVLMIMNTKLTFSGINFIIAHTYLISFNNIITIMNNLEANFKNFEFRRYLERHFHLSLTFWYKARTINALAYYRKESVTAKKCFVTPTWDNKLVIITHTVPRLEA